MLFLGETINVNIYPFQQMYIYTDDRFLLLDIKHTDSADGLDLSDKRVNPNPDCWVRIQRRQFFQSLFPIT